MLTAVLIVLVSALAFNQVVYANTEVPLPAYIKFKGYTLGKCFVMYGDTIDWATPPDWYGTASGSMTLEGYAKTTDYIFIEGVGAGIYNIYGWTYFAAPGDVKATGFLTLKWFENNELHQLWLAIYSKSTSQGIFQPKTDKFVAGFLNDMESFLNYKGIYKIGSTAQYLSGSIAIWATKGIYSPWTGIEYTAAMLQFGDHIMVISWGGKEVSVSMPYFSATVPAATVLVRDVKLL